MSARKLLLLTAVVAVLFGFIFLFERKMPSTADRERKGELHWDLPEDRIERLSLTRGAEQLEFQKTAAGPWRMVKPAPYPADAFAIDAVTAELADLKRTGGDSGEAKPADYGLEKPEAKATIVWTEPDAPEEKKTRTLEFGLAIPGTDIVAARVEGSDKVLFVPASTLAAVRKNADDFRSREVFGGSPAEISRLEILRGRGRPGPRAPGRGLVDRRAHRGSRGRGRGRTAGRTADVGSRRRLRPRQRRPGRARAEPAPLSGDRFGSRGRDRGRRLRGHAVGRQQHVRETRRPGLHGRPRASATICPGRRSRSGAPRSRASIAAT